MWLAALALVGGAHWLFQRILRRRRVPRPREFPTVMTVALGMAGAVFLVAAFLDIDAYVFPFLPLVCLVLSVLGAAVMAWVVPRRRFVSALAAIVALALVLVGAAWLTAAKEDDREREELLADVADFPLEIADGVRATLSTDPPTNHEGTATMEFPDIDIRELSGHVRPAEPGEAEEIATAVG